MNLRSNATFGAAGIALIVVVNAIVLIGVRYNRALPADSTLQLSERELTPSTNWAVAREDSGLDLGLQVRVPTANRDCELPCTDTVMRLAVPWGNPEWLNEAKLRALGFPVASAGGAARSGRSYDHLLPKDVYVVLEFDGPSYQHSIAQADRAATKDEQQAQAAPDDQALAERARDSRKIADNVRQHESRLFCIDAGLDPIALRKAYADRSHFAIVRGTIGVGSYGSADKPELVGQFVGVRIDEINVPLDYRPVFGERPAYGHRLLSRVFIPGADNAKSEPRYDVSVAWGRRLEPWIRGATVRQQ